MRILVTGTSGFIGNHLVAFLKKKGHEVVSFSFSQEPQKDQFEHLDGLIHLAGASIATKRWSKTRKQELIASRVATTEKLAGWLKEVKQPPKLVIVASAIGFYGDRADEILTEKDSAGHGFLAALCQRWEQAALLMKGAQTRVIKARFGVVMSAQGGMLAKLLPFFKRGFGAIVGSGHQYLSWIHLEDLMNALYFLLSSPLEGVVNCVAPCPLRQKEFALQLAQCFGKKVYLKAPNFLVKLLGGQRAKELLLFSQRVHPQRLEQSSFVFQYPLFNEDCLF